MNGWKKINAAQYKIDLDKRLVIYCEKHVDNIWWVRCPAVGYERQLAEHTEDLSIDTIKSAAILSIAARIDELRYSISDNFDLGL